VQVSAVSKETRPGNPYAADCPTRQLLDRVGDRWTVLIIGALSAGPLRYTALATRIEGISQKMLTQTLRALERDGLVTRTVLPVIPPHVEYELSALGSDLLATVSVLERWAINHINDVESARRDFDARSQAQALPAR
jgi:DNA-binding HxlR family transcriptional regulator